MKIGSLFSGYGGLDLAVEAFYDADTVWHSDIDPGAAKILAHRWPGVPNLGDITTHRLARSRTRRHPHRRLAVPAVQPRRQTKRSSR